MVDLIWTDHFSVTYSSHTYLRLDYFIFETYLLNVLVIVCYRTEKNHTWSLNVNRNHYFPPFLLCIIIVNETRTTLVSRVHDMKLIKKPLYLKS